jgi:hypothetical protein
VPELQIKSANRKGERKADEFRSVDEVPGIALGRKVRAKNGDTPPTEPIGDERDACLVARPPFSVVRI